MCPFLIMLLFPLVAHIIITAIVARASGILPALAFFFVGGLILFFSLLFLPLFALYFIIALLLIMPAVK